MYEHDTRTRPMTKRGVQEKHRDTFVTEHGDGLQLTRRIR